VSGTGPATILVVEDNALNLKLVRDVLTHAGYRIVSATSGEEGVRLASEVRPDLVLMDLQLPGIDGAEALRRLRATVSSTLPVVAVTAFAMDEDRAKAERDGFDGYLRKPISVRALPQQVRQILGETDDDDS
jgi:two-component system cell cycle response regulator DivK